MSKTLLLAAMIVAWTGAGQAEELGCAVLARTFKIPDNISLPDIEVRDATVSLIGDPTAKSIGFSFKGVVAPQVELQEEQKLLLYLYIACDNKSPEETSGINVGIIPIGSLKGSASRTLIATTQADALVPLKSIECVKIGVG